MLKKIILDTFEYDVILVALQARKQALRDNKDFTNEINWVNDTIIKIKKQLEY